MHSAESFAIHAQTLWTWSHVSPLAPQRLAAPGPLILNKCPHMSMTAMVQPRHDDRQMNINGRRPGRAVILLMAIVNTYFFRSGTSMPASPGL